MDVLFLFIGLISCTMSLNYLSAIEDATLTEMGAMAVSLSVSDLEDLITISITGPSSVYYSIGVGSCEMSNSWALVVPGVSATGGDTPFEQLLGHKSAGDTLDSTFDIQQDTISGELRTVIFSRSLSHDIDDAYYAFSTDDDELNVMWAYGTKADYSNHGEYQRDCATLSLTKTLQTESVGRPERSSTDSLYFFGQSSTSLIFVLVLLSMVLVYAV
eukprot:UN01023